MASHQRYERGDADKALAEADVVVQREYRTPWVHQSYMEPQVCAATVDPLGSVVVYACTQAMFRTRDTVAAVLGKSPSQVLVYAMPVGGGFGGKFGLIEPLVAACAVAVGRPVRLTFTRIEDFSAPVCRNSEYGSCLCEMVGPREASMQGRCAKAPRFG